MESTDGVLSVQPDFELTTRTTHTPEFLGFTRSGQLWEQSRRGEGKVIGVVEFGFDSSHESFSDDGMTPPPPSWKGKCNFHPEHCNNKLIGNWLFNSSENVSRKFITHGTHVASTAAGNTVMGASFRGEACGSASGTAPRAHLAFYWVKVGADLVKAIDQVIHDGVDVLSLSILYKGTEVPFYRNSINIGTLSATKRGIFVSASVGNSGPRSESVEDHTPWTLSVGASTTDRVTRVEIRLGNGDVILGDTVNAKSEFFPGGASLPAVLLGTIFSIRDCGRAEFFGVDVSGKAVVCRQGSFRSPTFGPTPRSCNAEALGAKAMIMSRSRSLSLTRSLWLVC